MQQAIYNNSNNSGSVRIQADSAPAPQPPAVQTAGVRRWVSRKWDFVGVLALMGSSAAYGVFALAHVGL